ACVAQRTIPPDGPLRSRPDAVIAQAPRDLLAAGLCAGLSRAGRGSGTIWFSLVAVARAGRPRTADTVRRGRHPHLNRAGCQRATLITAAAPTDRVRRAAFRRRGRHSARGTLAASRRQRRMSVATTSSRAVSSRAPAALQPPCRLRVV